MTGRRLRVTRTTVLRTCLHAVVEVELGTDVAAAGWSWVNLESDAEGVTREEDVGGPIYGVGVGGRNVEDEGVGSVSEFDFHSLVGSRIDIWTKMEGRVWFQRGKPRSGI